MAWVAVIAAVVSAAATAYTTYEAHEQQADQAKYNQKVAERNKQIVEQQAQAQANAIAAEKSVERHRLVSKQLAAFGASGADISGSAVSVMNDDMIESLRQQELSAQRVLYEGRVKAYGYQNESQYQKWLKNKAESTQWMDTILRGVSSGVGTYAAAGGGRGGFGGGGGGGYSPPSESTQASNAGFGIDAYDPEAGGLLKGASRIPRYRNGGLLTS